MKESELQKAIGSLPRSMKPQRDLWPGINERLEAVVPKRESRYKVPFWRTPAMAAAVLLALAAGIFIGRGMDAGSPGQMSQTVEEYALIGTVKATELEYQAAFGELVPLDYSGLRLEGEEPDALRGSWEALLQAETALLAALQQYPSDIYLNEKLLDLRSQQLQFVKQLALLEQNDWRRT
ncbi:MAG TPA: hypothetical protein VIS57_06415 [Xanthomonadales bacterium]